MSLKESAHDLAMAAQDYMLEAGPTEPQLMTVHVGDELTLTIMVCATITEPNIHDRLGAALSKIAESVMNESVKEASR